MNISHSRSSSIFKKTAHKIGPYVLSVSALLIASEVNAKTLRFSGYEFEVRPTSRGTQGPGDNYWSEDNAWVDSAGRLHLRFSKIGMRWRASEVISKKKFGFGTYSFVIDSPNPNNLDKNAVLGLFQYPVFTGALDTTHEIDIEISKFGIADMNPVRYTVYPTLDNLNHTTIPFPFKSTSPKSYHKYTRASKSIAYSTMDAEGRLQSSWTFAPRDYLNRISQVEMPVLMNLWGVHGKIPSNGKPVEVIIEKFSFTPLQQ